MVRTRQIQVPLRYFTPKEANDMLPHLMEDIDEATHKVRALRGLLEGAKSEAERRAKSNEIDGLRQQILACVERIQAKGVEVKGVDGALLDFPALLRGERVCLCWQAGETEVTHYHPMSTGFAGRKPIAGLGSSSWEWRN